MAKVKDDYIINILMNSDSETDDEEFIYDHQSPTDYETIQDIKNFLIETEHTAPSQVTNELDTIETIEEVLSTTNLNHEVGKNSVAGEVEDIILNPPATNKYTTLKEQLIQRLSTSEEERVRRLLSEEELGDQLADKIMDLPSSPQVHSFDNTSPTLSSLATCVERLTKQVSALMSQQQHHRSRLTTAVVAGVELLALVVPNFAGPS
ncbi:unnamed protein product [Arctia plantaginis]|uniref:DUF7041 domain-containing protein n=1 Tax=Arctia plantaginis TaxID=874455 RepID=A0A8S1BL06_ARCPL|nr:unnamed protein product [Arctia plantaginis]